MLHQLQRLLDVIEGTVREIHIFPVSIGDTQYLLPYIFEILPFNSIFRQVGTQTQLPVTNFLDNS